MSRIEARLEDLKIGGQVFFVPPAERWGQPLPAVHLAGERSKRGNVEDLTLLFSSVDSRDRAAEVGGDLAQAVAVLDVREWERRCPRTRKFSLSRAST